MKGLRQILILGWLGLWGLTAHAQPQASASACVLCHQNADFVGEEGARIVPLSAEDVHSEVGLSCHDCHGGNPDASLAEDPEASMDEGYAPNPFRPTPGPAEIAGFCGSCHSDPVYMRRFKPGVRVDQESEYATSQHGLALAAGNTRVATCVGCHDAHGVLRVGDPDSPVYPNKVAATCSRCHSDAEYMSGSAGPLSPPLPVDQYGLWSQSVHAQALLEREDLSAPTCNDCHGNHGAVPPGVDSIVYICGQCHGREAELFRQSPKFEAWEEHNQFLAEAGSESCLACHDESSPPARMTAVKSFGECTVCHGDHGVVRPSVALFSPLPETPCAFCHEGEGPLSEEIPELASTQELYLETRDQLLQEASRQGLEAEARFNWLVEQTSQLSLHGRGTGTEAEPHPEFKKLFEKFRIGQTRYSFIDPISGESKSINLVRCTDCHSAEEDSSGLLTGIAFLSKMQELTALTARAERLLLAARRGGVESRAAFLEVEKAVDSQISLEVLVHTFAADGEFAERQQEGMESVRAALSLGSQAQEELHSRRFGLAVSLFFIVLLLIALGLKIRWS